MLFWCVIILVLVNVVTLASFWMRRPPVGPRRGVEGRPGGQRIMEERLGLSDEQAQQFEQIRNEHFMRTRPLQDDMHKIRMDLLDELFSSETNEAKMQMLLTELGDKLVQFEKNLYQHFQELKEACNDQQLEELRIMLRELIESTRPRDTRPHPHEPEGSMQPEHRPPAPPNR